MRAVMAEVPADYLQLRRRRGADVWDEMWEGVLHMSPAPNIEHQDFEYELEAWLRTFWANVLGRQVYHGVNVAPVGGWPDDYRIPDLVLLAEDCAAMNRGQCLEGPPTVVIEIQSPGDETLDKLPFYASLGVPEVWVIDRDSRAVEVYALRAAGQEPIAPSPDGWLHSAATGVELRAERGKLAMQMAGNPGSLRSLPKTGTE
jgi:Uma2 family endonuclease